MNIEHYLLSLQFIRETEKDLEAGLRSGLPALEEYERLIAALADAERAVSPEKESLPSELPIELPSELPVSELQITATQPPPNRPNVSVSSRK